MNPDLVKLIPVQGNLLDFNLYSHDLCLAKQAVLIKPASMFHTLTRTSTISCSPCFKMQWPFKTKISTNSGSHDPPRAPSAIVLNGWAGLHPEIGHLLTRHHKVPKNARNNYFGQHRPASVRLHSGPGMSAKHTDLKWIIRTVYFLMLIIIYQSFQIESNRHP